MSKPRSSFAYSIWATGFVAINVLLTGCERTDQITDYTVAAHDTLQSPAFQAQSELQHPKPNRMIGVVIPQSAFQWYFKLEGEPVAVASREKDVRSFLQTVSFPSPSEVTWSLPDGWKRLPASEMRYSTIKLDGAANLEISVTKLPTQPEMPVIEQVLANINRWRGQLSLPAIDEEDLSDQSEKLDLNGSVAYWINITGRPRPRPTGMNMPARQAKAAPHAPANVPNNAPKFEKPAGWEEGRSNGVAVVLLRVQEGDEKIEITVTPAGGRELDNVNRWRGQLKLESIGEDELARTVKDVNVGALTGHLHEMSNDEKATYGVIVEVNSQSWFIKLTGNKALAEGERPKFIEFLSSLKWN